MNNKIQKLILGIYLSVSIGICGYFYINPKRVKLFYDGRLVDIHNNYSHFKYSILISVVVGILIFTLTNFFKKK
jgi:hypothetical protein